jgi:hypothetical protein
MKRQDTGLEYATMETRSQITKAYIENRMRIQELEYRNLPNEVKKLDDELDKKLNEYYKSYQDIIDKLKSM